MIVARGRHGDEVHCKYCAEPLRHWSRVKPAPLSASLQVTLQLESTLIDCLRGQPPDSFWVGPVDAEAFIARCPPGMTSDVGQKSRRLGPLPNRSPGVVAVKRSSGHCRFQGSKRIYALEEGLSALEACGDNVRPFAKTKLWLMALVTQRAKRRNEHATHRNTDSLRLGVANRCRRPS